MVGLLAAEALQQKEVSHLHLHTHRHALRQPGSLPKLSLMPV